MSQFSPDYSFDFAEVLKRAIKYFIEGFVVALTAFYLPVGKKLRVEEILTIGLSASATFAILDMFAPAFASPARLGAGAGIGAKLVGF